MHSTKQRSRKETQGFYFPISPTYFSSSCFIDPEHLDLSLARMDSGEKYSSFPALNFMLYCGESVSSYPSTLIKTWACYKDV